jgi:hypothetical protein
VKAQVMVMTKKKMILKKKKLPSNHACLYWARKSW